VPSSLKGASSASTKLFRIKNKTRIAWVWPRCFYFKKSANALQKSPNDIQKSPNM
jgi:hypothetical protein